MTPICPKCGKQTISVGFNAKLTYGPLTEISLKDGIAKFEAAFSHEFRQEVKEVICDHCGASWKTLEELYDAMRSEFC